MFTAETLGAAATWFGILFGGGGLVTIAKVLNDRRAGVKGEERAARRDMVADRDGLIDTLLRQVADMDKRITRDERINRGLQDALVLFSDHIDNLEAHIYRAARQEIDLLPMPTRPKPDRIKEDGNE